MMPYRFSQIKDEKSLLKAIEYIHFACHKLCKQVLGRYLPVAGNIGVFCHYDDEYKILAEIRERLTDTTDNWNQKYFRLHKPIVIPAKGDIPETAYTYLYIRKPDPNHPTVGDLDFCMESGKYAKLKNSLLNGEIIKGAKVFERPNLDLVELYDPIIDVHGFVGHQDMAENVKAKQTILQKPCS
jgi:hypothetical protein